MPEVVYVASAQTYLRDRVAPVSAHVALVTNGEALQVVQHDRRFLQVKTGKGEVGWIEEHLVIDAKDRTQFLQLQQEHLNDPVVATGVLRDELYLHLKPGRDTERFYLLPQNAKIQLLVRASIPKQMPGSSGPVSTGSGSPSLGGPSASPQPPEPMEDWWLIRDSSGKTGWILARRMDVDVPDEIGGYSEGQKMVGAYVLTTIRDAASSLPNQEVPVYLALLNTYKDGLPYDFDQIRVFSWNLKKHRYETAYRQRDLEGYLPVKITRESVDGGSPVPVFSIEVATGNGVSIDPRTGAARPAQSEWLRYELLGQMVKRIDTGNTRPVAAMAKPAASKKRIRKHRKGAG